MKRRDGRKPDMTMVAGVSMLEQAVVCLSGASAGEVRLPWSPVRRRNA